ncbi:hypothetical protein BO221_40375 [Archangium sp. Cb G35]|uniref:hypothetical protein n=1 Tax=Archangium sp. Cb G35 TaxID=1920190 RepID=UPI000936AE19|nr:hypothetical protein [Archangium sp. Cb G35]OJT18347.1 hypothetical protein BO221_40375 [Archangium sp. Cb G35]
MKRLRIRTMTGLIASSIGLLAASTALAEESAEQAGIGPEGCKAYQSHKDDHVAVGWCDRGNGTWYVQARCGGPGSVTEPLRGTKGKRSQGKEKASILDCGGGYPLEMKVVGKKP